MAREVISLRKDSRMNTLLKGHSINTELTPSDFSLDTSVSASVNPHSRVWLTLRPTVGQDVK